MRGQSTRNTRKRGSSIILRGQRVLSPRVSPCLRIAESWIMMKVVTTPWTSLFTPPPTFTPSLKTCPGFSSPSLVPDDKHLKHSLPKIFRIKNVVLFCCLALRYCVRILMYEINSQCAFKIFLSLNIGFEKPTIQKLKMKITKSVLFWFTQVDEFRKFICYVS